MPYVYPTATDVDDEEDLDLASRLGRFGSARSQFNQPDPGAATPPNVGGARYTPDAQAMDTKDPQPQVGGRATGATAASLGATPADPAHNDYPQPNPYKLTGGETQKLETGGSFVNRNALRMQTNPTGQDVQKPLGMKLAVMGKSAVPQSDAVADTTGGMGSGVLGAVPGITPKFTFPQESARANGVPVPPASPTLPLLIQKSAEYGKPLDRSQYKMSGKERALGILGNFFSGLGGGNGGVTYVGPGAVSRKYYTDDADRKANFDNTRQQIADEEKLQEENRKGFDSAQKQNYQDEWNATREQNAQTRSEAEQARDRYNTAKAGIEADKQKSLAEHRDRVDQMAQEPKNYDQLVRAWAEETDPQAKASLEQAMTRIEKQRLALHQRAASGRGSKQADMTGYTAGENREILDRTSPLKARMNSLLRAQQLYKPGSASYTSMKGQVDDLQRQIDGVIQEVSSRRSRPGAAATPPSQRTITRDQLNKLAAQNKISPAAAEKQFRAKNYTIIESDRQ